MKKIILDASALIALIYQEKGAELVANILEHAEISAVNLSEVIAYMIKNDIPAEQIITLFEDLSIPVIPFDEEQSFIAGKLIKTTTTKGLSFGDRACLSLAIQKNSQVYTADRIWETLPLDIAIKLIR